MTFASYAKIPGLSVQTLPWSTIAAETLIPFSGSCHSKKWAGLGRSRPMRASAGLEVVLGLVHVGGFDHQRVPARDVGHALHKGAAVTQRAGFPQEHAVGIHNRARSGI